MDQQKKSLLGEFSRRAMQRLQDKKIPKKMKLHVPSLDEDITIRSLSYEEIAECATIDDSDDKNRSDKYGVYLAVVEPDLKAAAREIMEEESSLPVDQRTLLEPMDIVKVFDMVEMQQIAIKAMELSGAMSDKKVTVVQNLKN